MKELYQSIIVNGLVPSAVFVESWTVECSLRNLSTFINKLGTLANMKMYEEVFPFRQSESILL